MSECTRSLVLTSVGRVWSPSLESSTLVSKTLPDFGALRQYQPCTSTSLVRIWGYLAQILHKLVLSKDVLGSHIHCVHGCNLNFQNEFQHCSRTYNNLPCEHLHHLIRLTENWVPDSRYQNFQNNSCLPMLPSSTSENKIPSSQHYCLFLSPLLVLIQ
jgi:hypothetical protein